MLHGVSHSASAAAVRGGGKGPCQILVMRKGTADVLSVKPATSLPCSSVSPHGPPSQLPSLQP